MMLELKDIDTYYDSTPVLYKVSFKVDAGELVAILGRNGVGKSTTLKSIMGIVPPRNGSILYKNEQINGEPPFHIARKGLGYVPEERRIFPGLTVRENLIMGQRYGKRSEISKSWTIDRVYARFPRLKERDKILGGYLSGGEQQLLTMGRTLVGNPEMILIDEPSEGLSPLLVKVIFDTIGEVHKEKVAIILVDQNLPITCKVAQRVIIMSKGLIVHIGVGKEVLVDKDIQAKYLAV
jgi:branched-chain amino acid transport system ATP-binding protein